MNLTLIQAYSGVQGYEGPDNWTPRPPGTLTLNPEGSCHSLNTSVANSNGVTGVQVFANNSGDGWSTSVANSSGDSWSADSSDWELWAGGPCTRVFGDWCIC